jgi:TolB-like protein
MKPSDNASDHAGEDVPSPAAVREELRRVLASEGLRQSKRMADLLRFVVSETLAGRADRLKEYLIASEVFGRDESFDPRTNALVRVEASRLRHRLREYFLGPGRDDPLHIDLPAGTYVPRFRTATGGVGMQAVGAFIAVPQREALLTPSERPSIAVLPFQFLGNDQRQRFIADGVAQELIAALSRIHWLRVIARNSTLAFTGTAAEMKQVGRETRARYLLGGSARLAGTHIRVFAELVDAITGNVLWAHRYARELGDVLDREEEVGQTIAAAVEREVTAAERERAVVGTPDRLDAWGLYQRGMHHMYRFTGEHSQLAKQLFRLAGAADPRFAAPFGALAYAGFLDFVLGFTDAPGKTIAEAIAIGRDAVARDDADPMAHFGLARALSLTGMLNLAKSEIEIAIELNPNFGPAYLGMGGALSFAGRHREAVDVLDVAIRLSPRDPMLWTMEHMRAWSHIELGKFDKAVDDAQLACRHANTVPWAYITLVSALSNLDREEESRDVRAALFARWPDFCASRFARTVPFDYANAPKWRQGLRRAGLDNG